MYIAPLKPQHVENTTFQWKSAGDEFTFYKKWGGHVPRVIYAPASIALLGILLVGLQQLSEIVKT